MLGIDVAGVVELVAKFREQDREIVRVFLAEVFFFVATGAGKFPIDVDAVDIVFADECDAGFRELLACFVRERRIGKRPRVDPAADGDEDFKFGCVLSISARPRDWLRRFVLLTTHWPSLMTPKA